MYRTVTWVRLHLQLHMKPPKQHKSPKPEKEQENLHHSQPFSPPLAHCSQLLLQGAGTEEGASYSLTFLMSPFRSTLSHFCNTHHNKWIISPFLHLLIIDKTARIQL